MNWSLLTQQFYGFFIFLIITALVFLSGAVGVLVALYQWNRTRTADLDKKIETTAAACVKTHLAPVESTLQKLEQNMDFQHRETMTLLDALERRLPKADAVHDHDNRIGKLESRLSDQRSEVDELFRRMRRIELVYAREHGSSSGEEETGLPATIPEPPRRPL